MPSWTADELESSGITGVQRITPPVVRSVLKRQAAAGALNSGAFSVDIAADLLAFCTGDVLLSVDAAAAAAEEAPGTQAAGQSGSGPSQAGPENGEQGGEMNSLLRNLPDGFAGLLGSLSAMGVPGLQDAIETQRREAERQQQGAAEFPTQPVNLDVLRDCMRLPYLAADGSVKLVGAST